MPHLIILDASHNQLTDFFGFQPPKNLKEVNFSHNQMSVMNDLSAYSSLTKLILDCILLKITKGLEKCKRLSHLSLAHNNISRIRGLDHLPLRKLCLRGNLIQKIENLQTLRNLQVLDLSCNQIQSLSGLQNLHLLGNINLESNLISEVKEAAHLHGLMLLREMNLLRNPVQVRDDYRLAVIFLLQHLIILDQHTITAEEKVSAVNKYDPPLEVIAARDHMTHLVYQLMQPQVIFDSTLPSLDAPYPMLVLTGPQACGKRELAHKLCQEFSDYFAYGACHTTRGPYYGEEDGSDYHFVTEEEFQNMIQMGQFVQTMQYGGHWYGLSREAIERVAREGLACCVHMELEGVYSLKNSYFEPRYVLLIPTVVDNYVCFLKARGFYSSAQMETAVSRIDLYSKTNRELPGFFDNIIPCDDRAEAYQTLKQLVKEYLGLEEHGGEGDSSSVTPDNTSTSELSQSHFAIH
uniref:Leucine-rich repeats and guanylate kinase domain containing n=1 Tax=Cyprinus carpio TaxID=7962 RepID=A0A8C1XHV5_CYPCA